MKMESAFSVGDGVFYAGITRKQEQLDCPDCLGEKRWTVTSPAGGEYQFNCPRCAATYMSDRSLSLSYQSFVPCVQSLTIGSVRYESENGCKYMCKETGVGSGTVYDEKDLFPTEDEALEIAKIKAYKNNKTNQICVEQYNAALRVCDFQLHELRLER